MRRKICAAASAFCIALSAPASAELIAWDDLINEEAQSFADPFRDLDYDQLDDLRTFAIEEARLDNAPLTEEQRASSFAKLKDAEARLTETGIDATTLLAQRWVVAEHRKKAATAVNPQVVGETISLAGFAIPAPPADDGTQVVYLVPERGMCAHIPPPNPNQMIRARINSDWMPSSMHQPVRLTGKLLAKDTQYTFRIVDGDVPMQASLVMEVAQVETADELRSDFPTSNDRFRARHTGVTQ